MPGGRHAPLRATPADCDDASLKMRLSEDGYLWLRGALDRALVLAAREALLARLAAVGEIAEPCAEAVATGTSRRAELAPDLGAFWRERSEAPELRAITHGAPLRALCARVLGDAATPFDFLWLRATPPRRASPLHFDHPYMGRGSARVLSVWIPLGDVALEEGPLTVVEGGHRLEDLIAAFRGHDVDRDSSRPGYVATDALEFVEARGTRLLASDVAAGDAILFAPFTLHGSLDNASRRVRLSCDARYQPTADPRDERWFGDPPLGHGGGGYGALSSAQPLDAEPPRR